MNQIFVAYRFTGEEPKKLKETMHQIIDALSVAGNGVYCTIDDSEQFHNKEYSGKQIMDHAFNEIEKADFILFFVNSEKISQGMLLELGYCIAKNKKMILVIQKDIQNSIFRRHIFNVLEFTNLQELMSKLQNADLSNFNAIW